MQWYWQKQAKSSCRTDWENVVEPAAANTRDAEHGEEDNADDVEPEVEPACNCHLRSRRHGVHGQLEGEWEAGGDEAVPSHSQEQDGDVGLDHSGRVDNTKADQGEIDEYQSGKHVEDSNSDLKIPVAEVNDPDSSNTRNGSADGGKDGKGIDPALSDALCSKTHLLQVINHHGQPSPHNTLRYGRPEGNEP